MNIKLSITLIILNVKLIIPEKVQSTQLCSRWRPPQKHEFIKPQIDKNINNNGNNNNNDNDYHNHTFDDNEKNNNFKTLDNHFIFHILKHKLKVHQIPKIPTTTSATTPDCICVPYYQCDINNTIISDGIGLIDVR